MIFEFLYFYLDLIDMGYPKYMLHEKVLYVGLNKKIKLFYTYSNKGYPK